MIHMERLLEKGKTLAKKCVIVVVEVVSIPIRRQSSTNNPGPRTNGFDDRKSRLNRSTEAIPIYVDTRTLRGLGPGTLKGLFMRREFKMSTEQYARLIEACRPVPYMIVGGFPPMSAQDNANAAWHALGREIGFDGNTANPINGKSSLCFTAEKVELDHDRSRN